MVNADDLTDLVATHKWVPVASLVLATVVRLLKSDTKIPIDIPPRWRIWLAFGLGQVSAVVDMVATGRPWKEAMLGGLASSVLAILGQNVVIDSVRGGKEFVVPGLTLPGVPPSPGKPPSIRPPSLPGVGGDTLNETMGAEQETPIQPVASETLTAEKTTKPDLPKVKP